jgi:DNA invertase Pin-like site-specific DNA recombinase
MGKVWGYARVSTAEQNPSLQLDALKAAGVPAANIVVEHVSGATNCRPEFEDLVARLEPGDTLTVWKVDRLGRSTLSVLETAKQLKESGIRIVVTTLGVDLTAPAGRMLFTMLAQIAEFERETALERINAGIAAAKARKKHLGRPPRLNAHQRREAAQMVADGKSYGAVAAHFNVDRAVAYRAVRKAEENAAKAE